MSHINQLYLASRLNSSPPLLKGLDRLAKQLLGVCELQSYSSKALMKDAEAICDRSLELNKNSPKEIHESLLQSKNLVKRGVLSKEQQFETLSLLCEVAAREVSMRPYPVQIIAVMLLEQGILCEMATGEGKSLVISLAAILAGWSGKPCHIITANDYLAERDARAFAPLFQQCGLTSGHISAEMPPAQRKHQYQQSIVYTTGKELLADFLRDQITLGKNRNFQQRLVNSYLNTDRAVEKNLLLRGIDTAIVDEADSVLIDEATTPLIISCPQPNALLEEGCRFAYSTTKPFLKGKHYKIDPQLRKVELTKEGNTLLTEAIDNFPAFFRHRPRAEELALLAITAREFFHLGKEYVIEEDKIVIIDEFTGRKLEQRTWQHGLQQLIELKENLPVSSPNESLAQLSFQVFFTFFHKLSGTTGTAKEASREFWEIYSLPVIPVPLNKSEQLAKQPNRHFSDKQEKFTAILEEVRDCYKRGQPVLIGTRTIADSEKLGSTINNAGIPCKVLNAVQHHKEAEIIATAGQLRSVTIATNMAGRGADINLGEGVSEKGGLHIIVCERHESKRIDRQLIGRSARQGIPGTFRIYSCDEDLLLQASGSWNLLSTCFGAFLRPPVFLVSMLLTLSQRSLQRLGRKRRMELAKWNQWLQEMLP